MVKYDDDVEATQKKEEVWDHKHDVHSIHFIEQYVLGLHERIKIRSVNILYR